MQDGTLSSTKHAFESCQEALDLIEFDELRARRDERYYICQGIAKEVLVRVFLMSMRQEFKKGLANKDVIAMATFICQLAMETFDFVEDQINASR